MMATWFSLSQLYRWMRASFCSSMGRTGRDPAAGCHYLPGRLRC